MRSFAALHRARPTARPAVPPAQDDANRDLRDLAIWNRSRILLRSSCTMDCRAGCGACCVAPSISSPIPGMPDGKPAGVRCIHLTAGNLCALFGRPERPAVCSSLRPSVGMCGPSAAHALEYLETLERLTRPEDDHSVR